MKSETTTVLLVEDNPDGRELAMLAFEEVGLLESVVACEDAEQALEQLSKWEQEPSDGAFPHRPDLILLDIKLPGSDGFHVLEAVRANSFTRFVPVIMLSSSSEESDIIKSYQLGANGYIRKPVNFERFVEVAGEIKSYWLTLNETPSTIV
ncbi:MAG: response regulator [Betaproteobacteria bacterium]|nr:MAG: response regulator [Betaproteobacteria bacterium]